MENPSPYQGTDGNNYEQNGAVPPQTPPQQGMPPQNNMPPQGYYQQQPYGAPAPSGKTAVAAGLLGIFLGWTGAHDYYLGYKSFGIIHSIIGGGGVILIIVGSVLPMMMLSSYNLLGAGWAVTLMPILLGLGWLCIAGSSIWGLIEGIMCLTKSGKYSHDANGAPLV